MKLDTYAKTATVERSHWWFRARGHILSDVLRKYLPSKPLQILDIGCGTGGDYAILSPFGKVVGVDVFPEAVAWCQSFGWQDVMVQDALSLQFPEHTFDVVCCLDVINGVPDDSMAVSEALRVLKPGGIALYTVAAHSWLWGETDIASQHLRRYSKKSLEQLFIKHQVTVLKSSGMNMFLLPIVFLTRWAEKLRPREEISNIPGLQTPPKLLNNLLYMLFNVERFIIPYCSLPVGVSRLVVIRKNS